MEGSSTDMKIVSNWFYGINNFRLSVFAIFVQWFTILRKLLIINIILDPFYSILIVLKFQYYCLFSLINKINEVLRNFIENSFKAAKFVINISEILFKVITGMKTKFFKK